MVKPSCRSSAQRSGPRAWVKLVGRVALPPSFSEVNFGHESALLAFVFVRLPLYWALNLNNGSSLPPFIPWLNIPLTLMVRIAPLKRTPLCPSSGSFATCLNSLERNTAAASANAARAPFTSTALPSDRVHFPSRAQPANPSRRSRVFPLRVTIPCRKPGRKWTFLNAVTAKQGKS